MKKYTFFILVALIGMLSESCARKSASDTDIKDTFKKYKEHPFHKTLALSKKERKAKGLPPNKYFEQEYLLEMNPSTGRTHPENLLEVKRDIKNNQNFQRVPGDAIDNSWEERGPNNIGGRTRVVMFDPNDTEHKRVFAGGVSGGLWVNEDITDSNSSWTKVAIDDNLAVTCMTVDPNNSQIMYLGTGETYTQDNGMGNGVWKSIDGGATWVNVFNDSSNPNLSLRIFYINDIVAWNNPATNTTELFIGVSGSAYQETVQFIGQNALGLYKSTDHGDNWNKVTLNTTQGSPYDINDFEVGPDNALWMSSRSNIFGNGGGVIFKSTNGTVFEQKHSIVNGLRTEIAVSKQDGDKLMVLAEISTIDGSGQAISPFLSMLKTTDGFSTTSTMSLPADADTFIPNDDFTRGQAFYDLVLEVDPNDDTILYAGGIDFFRSSDTGTSWNQMTKWSNNNALANLTIPFVHADQHALTFHPTDSDKAILGTDGGVYYASSLLEATTSTSNPNTFIESRNKDLNITQYYNGAIGSESSNELLLAGSQDNGTQFIEGAASGVNSFQTVFGGDGAHSFIDKDGEYIIVSQIYNDKISLALPHNGTGLRLDSDYSTGSFINPQSLDDNLDILYSSASNNSFDSIVRYSGINPAIVPVNVVKKRIGNTILNTRITALKVSPFTTTSTTLFVGLSNGKLLKVTDADKDTQVWTEAYNGITHFLGGSISSISFGASEDEILLTYHNYGISQNIFYTSNGGVTWTNKEGDFPDIPVKTGLINPLNSNEVIIGTELGVWRTGNFNDVSPNWSQSQNGMSNVKVTSLELRSSDNTVLATTYGRGMFTGKFSAFGLSTDEVLADTKMFTIFPTISSGEVTLFAKNTLGKSQVKIFDISGKQVYTTNVDFNERRDQQISINVRPGVYIVNLIDENNKKASGKIIIE